MFGNSMVAIVAGVVSQKAADLFGFVSVGRGRGSLLGGYGRGKCVF